MDFREFITELKTRCDIVGVISKYIRLEKRGVSFWGCCPFHREKTASFSVNQLDGYYYCFGCKESGDVIKFVQKMESSDFGDAVKNLAASVNLPMPERIDDSGDATIKKETRDKLYALLKDAAIHYHSNLMRGADKTGINYLSSRGLSTATIKTFGLGYSVGNNVISELERKGYSHEMMRKAGIAGESDNRIYDVFSRRVMFPIINQYGDVVGFGGRALDSDVRAKYRNTAGTDLFDKKQILYNVNRLVKQKRDGSLKSIIVVEGYMDAISLYQAGITNVAASMGTALTVSQAKQLRRLTEDVFICYDGDTAGKLATLRGLDILRGEGINVRVVSLPEGLDPDDAVKAGKDSFLKFLESALPLMDFKLSVIRAGCDMNAPDGKTEFAIKAVEAIAALDNKLEQERYIRLVYAETGFTVDYLKKQLEADAAAKPIVLAARESPESRATLSAKKRAILFMLRAFVAGKPIPHDINLSEHLETDAERAIFGYVCECEAEKRKPVPSNLYHILPEEAHGEVVAVLEAESNLAPDEAEFDAYFVDCIKSLRIDIITNERQILEERLKGTNLISEQNEILQRLKEIAEILKKTNTDGVD